MSVQKHPLILFSGGMDSTFLLGLTLSTTHAYTLYVDGDQYDVKVIQELKAREKLFKVFKEQNLSFNVIRDYKVDNIKGLANASYNKFIQPITWLMAAIVTFNEDIHSELLIGYLADDQTAVEIRNIRKLWKSAWRIMHSTPPPPIRFPLVKRLITKQTVVNGLIDCLKKYTWVCESPVKVKKKVFACNVCDACIKLNQTIEKINIRNNPSAHHPLNTISIKKVKDELSKE